MKCNIKNDQPPIIYIKHNICIPNYYECPLKYVICQCGYCLNCINAINALMSRVVPFFLNVLSIQIFFYIKQVKLHKLLY